MEHHSVFDYMARDDDSHVIAGRQALSLSSKRVDERFSAFLSASGTDVAGRLELIRDDFNAVVAAACEEVGHADVEGLTSTLWNDQVSRISGENPFAKKDDDDDDDKCDCKGDEECAKCKKKDKKDDDDKGNPFAKKDSSRIASVHEARKPKVCPYHNEVMGISLAQGEAQAGFNAMAQHAWGPKHCKGDEYDGIKCNFKPEMTTQSYWDTKAEKAEERKLERAEQQVQTPEAIENVEPIDEAYDETPEADGSVDSETIDNEGFDTGGEVEGLPEQELMAVAASAQRFVPLTVKMAKDGDEWEDGRYNGLTCPKCGGHNTAVINQREFDRHLTCANCQTKFKPSESPDRHAKVADQRFVSKTAAGAFHCSGSAKESKTADLAPQTQAGIAAELQSMVTQGMSHEKALQMLADRHGLSEEQIYSFAERHNSPSPSTDQFFNEMHQHRAAENTVCRFCNGALEPWNHNGHAFMKCPHCNRSFDRWSRVAETLEHQDVTKNTHPDFTKEHSHGNEPPKTEGEGSAHPTERVDIQPDITEERKNPANKDELEDIGEAVTEHQDVTRDSEFNNKYPNRWASVDQAVDNFNRIAEAPRPGAGMPNPMMHLTIHEQSYE